MDHSESEQRRHKAHARTHANHKNDYHNCSYLLLTKNYYNTNRRNGLSVQRG